MTREFKITLNEEDNEELLLPYLQADSRENFLFELFHNFFRTWKHTDGIVNIEDVKEKLWELKENYKVTLKDD